MKTHKALQQLIQSAAILAILLSLSVYASENTKHQHVHPEKTASKKQQETKKQIQHKMHVSKESADDKVMKNILEKYEQLHQAFFTNKID